MHGTRRSWGSTVPRTVGAAALLAALGGAALWTGRAQGQTLFGQNKVVYNDRHWKVLQEDRINVYFYVGEDALARQTLRFALDAYREYSRYFDYEFTDPIPVILYGTHHDFKQTNVTPGFIPDFTGGFTEFAKGRVTLPATGSVAQLRHVIRHELVHAFMLSKLAHVMGQRGIFDYAGPPLWFTEGLAEDVARPAPDAQAEMFLRDALLNDGLPSIPDLWQIEGSFLMYKAGESILGFLRTEYGDRVPAQLLEAWWRGRSFGDVLQLELGLTERDLSERWINYLKRRYFPQLLTRLSPDESGHPVLEKPVFEVAPSFLRTTEGGGTELAMISGRGGLLSLYAVSVPEHGKAQIRLLVEGGRKARFETFPALRSRLGTHGQRLIAFVAKHGEADALFVYDVQAAGVVRELAFATLREIASPSFSPDGRRIAFSGLRTDGSSDIYTVELATGQLTPVTQDPYDDLHPCWHPSAARLVFASDRADPEGGRRSLYVAPLDSLGRAVGELERLTEGSDDNEPIWSPRGDRVLYVSDRSGTFNLHVLEGGAARQITNVTGGAFNPDWLPGESDVVASVYHKGAFALYRFRVQDARAPVPMALAERQLQAEPPAAPATEPPSTAQATAVPDSAAAGRQQPRVVDYGMHLDLDFVQSVVALDPDLPFGSGATLGLTDMLGNHQLFLHLSQSSEQFSLDQLNLGVSYHNLSRRLNTNFGLFRLATSDRLTSLRPTQVERRTGGFAGVTYPFSTFDRVELSAVGRYLERDASFQLPGEPGTSWLVSGFLSYVHDNALWTWQGPMRGTSYNLTLGQTFDVLGHGFDRQTVQLDVRRYFPIARGTLFAARVVERLSFGNDREFFYAGGPNDLRGYQWYEFFGNRLTLLNGELRFPLIDRIALRFPFGRLDFPSVRGGLFVDAATISSQIYDTGWVGGVGASVGMVLFPPLMFRVDFVRRTDFDHKLEPFDTVVSLAFLY